MTPSGPHSPQPTGPMLPERPHDVRATSGENQQSTITWAPPAPNGEPLTGFIVTVYTADGQIPENITGALSRPTDPTATSLVFEGLENRVDYCFAVAGVNQYGVGPASLVSPPATPRRRVIAVWWWWLAAVLFLLLLAGLLFVSCQGGSKHHHKDGGTIHVGPVVPPTLPPTTTPTTPTTPPTTQAPPTPSTRPGTHPTTPPATTPRPPRSIFNFIDGEAHFDDEVIRAAAGDHHERIVTVNATRNKPLTASVQSETSGAPLLISNLTITIKRCTQAWVYEPGGYFCAGSKTTLYSGSPDISSPIPIGTATKTTPVYLLFTFKIAQSLPNAGQGLTANIKYTFSVTE